MYNMHMSGEIKELKEKRDLSLITGRGVGYKMGGAGASMGFTHMKRARGGEGQNFFLAMLKGGWAQKVLL